MNKLQADIETVTKGLAMMVHFTINIPKPAEGPKAFEDYRERLKEHTEASNKWTKDEGPEVVNAALRIVGSLFTSLDRIALALENKP